MKRLIYQATAIALLTTSFNTIGILSPAISKEVTSEGSKVESTVLAQFRFRLFRRAKKTSSCRRTRGGKCQSRGKRKGRTKSNKKSYASVRAALAQRQRSSVNNRILSSQD